MTSADAAPSRPVNPVYSKMVSVALDGGLNGLSRLGKLHPFSRAMTRGVEVTRNVAYLDDGDPAHTLDVYRPTGATGPTPTLLYVHGGGFRILSKDSHWMFGYGFAQRGFTVFNVNYRLAPRHPYPAAPGDVAAALTWVLDHAADYGADPSRLVYAGESAGANLVLGLTLAGCWRFDEAFARQVFERDPRPQAVLPACGMLQVSNASRYLDKPELPAWVRSRIEAVCQSYLPNDTGEVLGLANPLVFLETAEPTPERALPAIHALCGSRDPVADDTHRLERALARHPVDAEVPFYDDAHHAFHAFVWQDAARAAWAAQDRFLERLGLISPGAS